MAKKKEQTTTQSSELRSQFATMTIESFNADLDIVVNSTKELKEKVWHLCKMAVLFALDGNITPAKCIVHNETIREVLRTDSVKAWFVKFGPFSEGNGQWEGESVKTLKLDVSKQKVMTKQAASNKIKFMSGLGKESPFVSKLSTADKPFDFAAVILKAIESAEKRKKDEKQGDYYGLDLPQLKALAVELRKHQTEKLAA